MEGLEQKLADLANSFEGKSKKEVETALKAYSVENKEALEGAVKEAKEALQLEMKGIQDQANAMEKKMNEMKTSVKEKEKRCRLKRSVT